ncbi:uncharacterized protein LOC124885766 [Capsicum annuum]|uniref:uncharacterized protein LOC124885766 n=1 Tax=Capsicum annuum TaxID=4072 RepID=UPI001FB18E3F|nr:uncharacterized protein LOC124885766 [Capsicum annuum]
MDGYKLWYSGSDRWRNGVGILVDEKIREQVGLGEEEKRSFWKVLEEVIRDVPSLEKLFLGGDFNGHIKHLLIRYDDMHGGFGFGERIDEGTSLLDFARAFGLVVVNSSFSKKEEHLVTFCNRIAKTQIDFLLLRKGDRALCKDYKVFLNENLATQHRLLVMDLVIKMGKKRRGGEGRPRVKWGGLTPISALEIEAKLEGMGAWEIRGDVDSMWDRAVGCIKETSREVLGVSRGWSGRYRGDW